MNVRGAALRRSRTNRIVVGVCGGLGDFFGVDPFWFRLGFLIAMAFEPLAQIKEIERFPTKHDVAKGEWLGQTGFFDVDDLIERRRRLIQYRDSLLGQQIVEVLRGPRNPVRNADQSSSREKTTPNFPYGKIECRRVK